MDEIQIYFMQVILAVGITIGSQTLDFNDKHQWTLTIVRYIVYILTIQGSKGLSSIGYDIIHKKKSLNTRLVQNINGLQIIMFVACTAILLSNNQKFFAEDFPLIFIACLIVEYPEIETKYARPINYGVGMACNFYEGYLMHVIPSDGGKYGGFVHNVHAFESREGIVVPVKKLFIVITKSLYSPPDLKLFNKTNREDLPKLEACTSLDDVEKDISGVKDRSYKNSTYKIYRRGRPVCLVAECATPLHTLHRVMQNKELYEDLAEINVEDVCNDFCAALTRILARSSECRDKVELVYYDDTDPESNLADVLLDKIKELEPNFEQLISSRL
ncbi:stimulator of interferon genes protein isoform X4 [Helicoverpa armigera]|uniref:stimulator of interferon genes protein isoform X4 n=1 Tax=Helicoverpa armigera TaxID=29058 RepID=UPI003082ED04